MGIFLIASFLLSLLFFINLAVRFDTYRIVGYLGIFYSLTAFCFWASNLLGLGDSFILSIFSNLVFLILVYYFVKDVKAYVPARHYKDKKEHYILVLFRYFVFVAVVVNFVFLGTLGVHEFGHYTTSKFYDCSYQSIIYEGNLPKTEVLCDDLSDINIILLGGIFLPIIFVILLFFVGNKFLRELGFLILGFQLIASYRDLLDLGISENLSFGLSFIGFLCLMVGIVLIIRSRTQEYAHSIL
ncbi:hypothetical protein GOV14_05385 [Candidatus Pacearchaeota archaeon]|nr:hypothetical protein [Candidatus Pacearchaeota archaeon]